MLRKPAFFWVAASLGTLFLVCFGVAILETCRYATSSRNWGYWVAFQNDQVIVSKVEPGKPGDGILQPGDRILAVNGHGNLPPWLLNRFILLAPGNGYHLTLQRGPRRLTVWVPIAVEHTQPFWWGTPVAFLAGLACFAVAMLMGLLKPENRTVQFGCLTFLGIAAMSGKPLDRVYFLLGDTGRAAWGLLGAPDPLPAVLGYLFASRFPRPIHTRRAWKILEAVVCAAVLIEWLRRLPWLIFATLNADLAAPFFLRFPGPMLFLQQVPHLIWKMEATLIFAAIAAVLIRNYRQLTGQDERRRIRWLIAGSVAALAPGFILYAGAGLYAFSGWGFDSSSPWFAPAEQILMAVMGMLLSATFGYAVLRHRLLDVHLVVRRSIQHLFAKHVLQAAISLPVILVAVRVALNPKVTVADLVFGSYFYLFVMIAATLGLIYRRPLLLALDRRFFREAYSQEQILCCLIEEIKERESVAEISELVSAKVESALHPSRILVFYRSETRGDFTIGHSSTESEPELRISSDCRALRLLEESSTPRDFPFSDSGPPSPDDEYLAGLGVRLMSPITGTERRLIGILMLGEKRSEEPYTATDRALVQAIAAQIGVVYENVGLRETAKREMQIKRHVLAHVEGAEINLLKECPLCGTCFDRTAERCPADAAALTFSLPVERIIDGVYRLERRIGAGGMGAVYRAMDLRLSRQVAVKVMVGSLFGNRTALHRFEREARAAARLSHPNIVAIYDFGTIGTDGAYLVMELVEGPTFRAELRAAVTLPPALAASRFDQLLEGLAAAHAAGIVHRDLKPENLIITRLPGGGDLLKILDFGLAKMMAAEGAETVSLTAGGAVLGTMGYMSPEQLAGEEVDPRSDLFSLGILVVEALTGRRPFAGLTFHELLASTLRNEYHLPGSTPEIRRLDAVLQRCLAKRAADRAGAAEIREPLVSAIRACPLFAAAAAAGSERSTIDAR